jgi:hypothetical protein
MKTGDTVVVEDVSKNQLVRRVVAVEGENVFVCTEEEYASAQRENREPICIGFKLRYIRSTNAAQAGQSR